MPRSKHSQQSGIRYSGTLNMADFKRFEEGSRKWAREAGRTKETALAELVKLGINTPTGRLTKNYRS